MTAAAEMDLQFTDNPDAQRYEVYLGRDRIGLAEYRLHDDQMIIPHTEITPRFGGLGYGSRLVRFALDDARHKGLRVVPSCPFVAAFIRRNPEYADLL